MKWFVKGLLGILIFLVIGAVYLKSTGTDLSHLKQQWGTQKMYVKIVDNGTKGPGDTRYNYQLQAYNEDGNETLITFSSESNLRFGAYLLVYVRDDKNNHHEIGRYDEVKPEKVPKKAKEKLDQSKH
ncbi:YxeA family protein [Bacillus mycoides]|uniref:YxeA family protein n=1 Tax=Bacillus mycoides TaxID=1405 RepID=UPI002111B1B7|nr:YxeA family protein [Bacillus mycoides]MCQ6531072.1 YxeA family protein [Bacillus mycoides]